MEKQLTLNANPQDQQSDEDTLLLRMQKHSWADIDAVGRAPHNPSPLAVQIPKEYEVVYDRFQKLRGSNQKSCRAFDLTSLLLEIDSGNYYALMMRKASYQNSKRSVQEQIQFLNHLLHKDSKSYQLWTYRKELAKAIDFKGEYEFVNCLLKDDINNYHVWGHRIWVTSTRGSYQQEWETINAMLESNFRFLQCNSYWNYRFFLFRSMDKDRDNQPMKDQIKKVIALLTEKTDGESLWNYMNGFFNGDYMKSSSKVYSEFPEIQAFCSKTPNRFSLYTLILIGRQGNNASQVANLVRRLVTEDPTREKYWEYSLQTAQQA